MEKRYVHKNGDIVWINMTIAPVDAEDKANPHHLCMVEDISQRKLDEINLKKTNENLEEMVYIASHDLQVPLISMEGYASELFEDYGDKMDENGKFCLSRLQKNAENMHKLVLSLLDISRLNTNKYPYEEFELSLIIDIILIDLSLVVQKQEASITVHDLPKLYADKQRMEGVFRNIIANSLNYG